MRVRQRASAPRPHLLMAIPMSDLLAGLLATPRQGSILAIPATFT